MSDRLRNFSPVEYQKVMLEAGSLKHFAIYLNITTDQARTLMSKYSVKLPFDYVRSLDLDFIMIRLAIHGSFKTLAKEFGVSRSFLVKHIRQKKAGAKEYEAQPRFTKTDFIKEVERIGTIALMARIYNCTETHLRKYATRFEIKLSSLLDYSDSGYSNAKGRRAEEYLRDKRSSVTRDLNDILGSKADYDLDDDIFKRINVKSSKPYKYKAKARKGKRYWKFSTRGASKADVFALLFMDDKEESYQYVMYVSAKSVVDLGKKTITISDDNLEVMDIDSIHFIDLDEGRTQIDE